MNTNPRPRHPTLTILFSAIILLFALIPEINAQETLGGGTIANPASGPPPSYGLGGAGLVLVKNWNFGSGGTSTIKNMSDMNANFFYHDQFNTITNKYGAKIVSPDAANALGGQPIDNINTTGPARQFTSTSLKTYLLPLDGATTVKASQRNVGCGSFMPKWKLPKGGSLLNQDIVWETRVRYVTPPYFWFAIWNSGNLWNNGAEIDIVESFGYDNGGGNTNFDGRYWHSSVVGGIKATSYSNWATGMASRGITTFSATQYHIWTLLYRVNNTYSSYVDGIEVQNGTLNWTRSGVAGGTEIDMNFLFDGTWGHTLMGSVNKSLPASALVGKYYDWDYSRIYLSVPDGGTDLSDNIFTFDNGNGNEWSAGTTPPWSILWENGGYAYDYAFQRGATATNTAGSASWSNYQLDLDVKITRMEPWSYTFIYGRYTNSNNYYQLSLEKTDTTTRVRLTKKRGGISTVLAASNTTLAVNTWYDVSLLMDGGHLVAKINGTSLIDVQDGTPLVAGKIGLGANKQGVRFDNITTPSTPVNTLLTEDLSDGAANSWTASPVRHW